MDLFKFMSQYFWLLAILAAGINYFFAVRSEEDPEVDREKRKRYLAWFWGLGTIPWIVLGVGQLVGGIPNVFAIFRPRDGNPYVWAFYAATVAIYLVTAYWILFRGGARISAELRLLKYNAPGKHGAMSEFWIKVLTIASGPFIVLWFWILMHMDVPVLP